jgi:hypothetical protein
LLRHARVRPQKLVGVRQDRAHGTSLLTAFWADPYELPRTLIPRGAGTLVAIVRVVIVGEFGGKVWRTSWYDAARLQLPSFTFPDVPDERRFDRIAEVASAAEGAGFDSFWVMDHLHQIANIGPETDPMLEAYTLLGGIAARTS